jgi:hypothetical protein
MKGFVMKFRSLKASLCLVGLLAMGMVALRAADDKTKGKSDDVPPAPGTIKFAMAPAVVQKTFKEESNNAKFELLGRGKTNEKDPNEKAIFRAIIGLNDSSYDLIVSEDGQVLSKILQPFNSEVKLEDCPAVVQKTLQNETKGVKVESVSKVSAGKRSDYVIEVVIKKLPYQVTIADDGTLISKVFDDGSESDENDSLPASASDKKETPKKGK